MMQLSSTLAFPDDAVTQTFAFLARRGAGKSYGAMKLAEEMLTARAQVIAIDPVGVWYSLRIAANGVDPGFDVTIFGGLHGDIPLEPGAGALVADLIVDRGICAVLDVSMFRKNERKQFATAFAEQLFHRKKERRSPVHLFVEEAQVFVPQRTIGDEARMLGAFEDLVKLGRNFGIGVTLISQRPQSVNKEALNQTETLLALQTNGAQERKALEAWIVEQGVDNKRLVDELPGLPIGTAYLWSPSWLRKLEKIEIARRITYDASATPVAGAERAEPRPLLPEELAAVREAMAATIAKAKADDPKELRKQIADLRRQIESNAKYPKVSEKIAERVEVPVLDPSVAETLRATLSLISSALDRFVSLTDEIQGALARVQRPQSVMTPPRPRPAATKPVAPPKAIADVDPERKLTKAERAVLTALAQYREPLALTRVAILTGYKYNTGGLNNALGSLRSAGFIERGDPAVITDAGLAALGAFDPLPEGDELRAHWLARLTKAERAVLSTLMDAYPDFVETAELATASGYTPNTGGFNNALGRLRTLKLAEGYREVRASPELFGDLERV